MLNTSSAPALQKLFGTFRRLLYVHKNKIFISPADVIEIFWKFNTTQVLNAHDSCPLTQVQKDDICTRKQNLFTVEEIQDIYIYYPAVNVSAVFDSCQSFANLEESPEDKIIMCNLQNSPEFEYGNPASAVFWDIYIEVYDIEQIKAHIQTCVPIGDSLNTNYHKNQLLNDVLDLEVKR